MKIGKTSLFLIIFWLILAGLIVWFKILPSGHITYSRSYPAKISFLGGKGFIGNFTPADRVNDKAMGGAEIFGDPVYFSVFTPRTFSEAKITITYQDNLTTSTPLIEAGVLVDNIVWRYKLASLENKLLDNGFSSWSKIYDGGILLLQKEPKFSTISEFLNYLKNKPESLCQNNNLQNCLALYNTENLSDYLGDDYISAKKSQFKPIEIPMQGAHQFYFTVDKKNNLKFDFDFADLNLDKKTDPIVISLYKNSEKIYSLTVDDNYGGDGLGEVRDIFVPFSYQGNNTLSGLYKLEIKAGEDIVIKKITDAPSALNVIGKVHPVKVHDLPLSFWTDSSFIKLTTNNPASRQSVVFGDEKFSLLEPYQQYEFSNTNKSLKEVILNKDDVILETDGVFSFSADSFFNPDFQKIDEHFVLSEGIDYVLANYQGPKILENGLKEATVILNTKEAYREKGKYSFMISVPGLSLNNSGNVLIKNIKIEFSGRTLWDKIKEYVN